MNFFLRFIMGFSISFLTITAYGQQLFFEQIIGKNNSPNTPIHGITKDSIGYIWLGSWNGVYRYDGQTFDIYRHNAADIHSLPNNRIRNIISDQEESLWLLTFDKKYVKYNYNRNYFETIADSVVPGAVVTMLNSSSNLLNRNSIIDNKRYYLSSHHLTELNLQSKDLKQYQANYDQPGGLADDFITSFYIDKQQIIWIGTRSGELYKANIKRKPFNLHYCYEQVNNKERRVSARAILKVGEEIWIGSNNSKMVINNSKAKLENGGIIQALSNVLQIRTLYNDNYGKVWIGSVNGLGYYSAIQKKYITVFNRDTHPGLNVWSVYAIAPGNQNCLWVGLYNGLMKIDLSSLRCEFYDLQKWMGDRSVMNLIEDRQQRLWMATEGSGIIRIELDQNGNGIDTLLINSSNGEQKHRITGDMVYSLYEDRWGNIWAGTSEGLNCIDANTLQVQHFTSVTGLPDNYISAVTGDNYGNIWVSHKRGISKIEPGANIALNYNITDKNNSWVFLDGSCYNDTLSHTIYFGAREGYISFNPDWIQLSPFKPNLILKNFYIADNLVAPMELVKGDMVLSKVLSQTENIKLRYANRNFAIELAALHFDNTGDNHLEYMLKGYDEKWKVATQSKLNYNKVLPGDYMFMAKAISPDQVSSNLVQLNIQILAPWYATKWAIAAYMVFIMAVLYLIYREVLLRERLKNQVLIERLKVEKQEELNREKMEFFTNVSHELRTPLTLITDPLKQIQNKKLTSDNRKLYLSIINRNIDQLTRLINQLLDFRKAEAGKLLLKPEYGDVAKVISNCIDSFSLNARRRKIDFKLVVECTPLPCYFDHDKLNQILMNLLSNAFKYTPDGGRVSVSVNYRHEQNELIILIEDNGIGIDHISLTKIFEPFNNEGTQPFYGHSSGMGLALTRQLIALLKGEIKIESIPKKGTKVSLVLPFERLRNFVGAEHIEQKEINKPMRSYSSTTEISNEYRATILIVEDNADVQDYLNAELSDQFLVIQAYNGKSGLEKAKEQIPDLIVSDVMMPEMDGNALCVEIKTNENTCHIPVILLTAKTSDENQIEGLQTGADAYLTKPFNINVLKAQMNSIIDNRLILQHKLSKKQHVHELENESGTYDSIYIQKIIQIIKENIDHVNFGTEQLAGQMEISQRQLYRKLKAISGSTVHEFITRVRMDEAAALLTSSNLNISEIAYKVGFSEVSNFSRTFGKHFGASPSKYRKQ